MAESKLILIFYAKEKLTPNMWILFYNYGVCMFIKFFEKKNNPWKQVVQGYIIQLLSRLSKV